ncbi:MAG: hypothetical protein LCH37_06855 [Bacteroidetes bacterium]|nr:hypothetical protein [Bacteroidota bacterium]
MKNQLLMLSALCCSVLANAQQVSYKLLGNNPQDYHPKLSVNLNIAGIETSSNSVEATNFYASVFGHYMLQDKLGIQFNVQRAWLTLAKMGNKDMPTASSYEAGAVLFFNKAERKRNERIVLKSNESTYNNKRVTTTTFITVPAKVIKYTGIRGGLSNRTTAFALDQDDYFSKEGLNMSSLNTTGLYAGLINRRLTHIVVDASGYGKRFKSIGFDWYADALVQFANKFTLRDDPFATSSLGLRSGADITEDVKKVFGSNALGFRIGMSGFQIAPKSETNKKFGMCYNFELGMMPYVGYYIKGGVGLTLVKK